MTYEAFKQGIEAMWRTAQEQGNRADELFYAKVLFNLVDDSALALIYLQQEQEKARDTELKQRYAQIIRELEACQ